MKKHIKGLIENSFGVVLSKKEHSELVDKNSDLMTLNESYVSRINELEKTIENLQDTIENQKITVYNEACTEIENFIWDESARLRIVSHGKYLAKAINGMKRGGQNV